MAHIYTPDNPLKLLHFIKGVAFDNDNTLYLEPEIIGDMHRQAGIEAIQSCLPKVSEESAANLMKESKGLYGGSLEFLTRDHRIGQKQVRDDHYRILTHLTKSIDFIDLGTVPQKELDLLKAAGIPYVMLTHGNLAWSLYTSGRCNISDHFNEQNIFTKDHVRANKVEKPYLYEAGLDYLGAPQTKNPQDRGIGYAMVEDYEKNLKWAKALGMTTFLVNTDLPPKKEIPHYVDVVAPSTADAIQCILMSNKLHLEMRHEQLAHLEDH